MSALIALACLACVTVVRSYKMGQYITCLEQNDESPYGFKESMTWGNPLSEECAEYPDLCTVYTDQEPFAGRGDVCDHADPETGRTRNACKFAVRFGAEVDDEKTWSWKCVEITLCPYLGDDGFGTVGCKITDKTITCCCQDDYCTADPLYAAYAQYGRPEKYPPNYDEILAINRGVVNMLVEIPGYEDYQDSSSSEYQTVSDMLNQYPDDGPGQSGTPLILNPLDRDSLPPPPPPPQEDSSDSSDSSATYNMQYTYAKSPVGAIRKEVDAEQAAAEAAQSINVFAMSDVMLIFSYFVIGAMCLGVGLFVGVTITRSKQGAAPLKRDLNDF